MSEPQDFLGRVRIAAPCPANWDAMGGDARVRFCRLCNLSVYNTSEMTAAEVVSLVTKTEGRVCARLYRRADGTLLTKDCPVGLRALRRRAARAAGAVFAAALSFFSPGSARTRAQEQAAACRGDWLRAESVSASSHAALSGTVVDQNGARVYEVEVTLTLAEKGREFTARTDAEGEFRFAALPAGAYKFEVLSPGFVTFRKDLIVGAGDVLRACVMLEVGMVGEIVILPEPDRAAVDSRGGATVFRKKALTRLPF
jgi:hypothetical protein